MGADDTGRGSGAVGTRRNVHTRHHATTTTARAVRYTSPNAKAAASANSAGDGWPAALAFASATCTGIRAWSTVANEAIAREATTFCSAFVSEVTRPTSWRGAVLSTWVLSAIIIEP